MLQCIQSPAYFWRPLADVLMDSLYQANAQPSPFSHWRRIDSVSTVVTSFCHLVSPQSENNICREQEGNNLSIQCRFIEIMIFHSQAQTSSSQTSHSAYMCPTVEENTRLVYVSETPHPYLALSPLSMTEKRPQHRMIRHHSR